MKVACRPSGAVVGRSKHRKARHHVTLFEQGHSAGHQEADFGLRFKVIKGKSAQEAANVGDPCLGKKKLSLGYRFDALSRDCWLTES
jgi:hypothetical protein